jgi:hypothetical protein
VQEQVALVETLPGAPPSWNMGDSWEYSDGYKVRVTDVDGDGVATLSRVDKTNLWTKRRMIFKQAEQSSDKVIRKVIFRSQDPASLFPLALGKSVKYTREYLADSGDKEYLRAHKSSWTVEGQETIEVPAGTFDTWVLIWRTESMKSEWTGYERWWYNAQVKHYVRMEYRYGEHPPGSRVLTKYNVCTGSACATRRVVATTETAMEKND